MTARLKAGEMVGRYRVEEHVGGGGFGDVYRATDPLLDRSVAIKVLRESVGKASSDLIKESLREARAASALNHPSIVTIHDVVEQPERACIVMEWIEGSSLRALLTGEPLAPAQVSHLGSQIASALARAHQAGIVHRDLKPENIMVRSDEVVKILDFGLARQHVTESGADLETLTGKGPGGTLAYMAPEQLRGEALDGGCDLFALGIILYEMTTGTHPFFAPAPYAIMQRILNADPAPPGSFADLPSGWSELIAQLLSKNRALRAAMAADLASVLKGGSAAGEAAQRVKAQQFQRDAHMVGRSRELALLERRWQDAASGAGNFVTIAAEPGAGKTTLLRRFLESVATRRGGLVANGRCSERLGSGEPYLPFLEALAELAGSPQGALVRAILRSKAPTWFTQLFPVISSDSSVEQVRREISGGSQERMRRELADALEEMGRSFSVCLALEDLHWSDLATTEQIAYLSNRIGTQRVLIVGTYRPTDLMAASHPLRPILLDMQGRGVALELQLELLNREDVAAYIDLEFPGHRFPADFPAWIYLKTEGSPLFMVDLLRYLTERHAIVEGARWELLKPIATLEGETPVSVRSMIERMIETLSEEQRQCLTVASVQGDTFDSLVQSEVTGVDELRLEEQLEVLHRVHRLVEPSSELEFPDGNLTVRHKFVHVLYQEALYQALTAKRKMLLHARVGEALEKHHATRTRMAAAELALHFDRARRTDRALPYYLKAAQNAVAKFAHVQAEGYCTRALELTDRMEGDTRDRERLPILKERGNTRFVMSRFDAAIADFQEMLTSAERLNDFEAEASARCFLAETFFMSKQNERLEKQVDRVLELADRHELTEAAAQGRMLLGLQRMCYGQIDESRNLLVEAERLSRGIPTGTTKSRALAWLSQCWFFQSDYERVLAQHKRLEAAAIERHDGFSLLLCYLFGGLTYANYGNFAEGVRTLEHGRKTADNNNDLFWLGRFPNCIAWTYHEAFDFPHALDRNAEAAEIARQTGFMEGEANSLINVGLARVELGDYDSAREQFEAVEEIFKVDEWYKWRYRLRLEVGWSEMFLRQGDLAGARARAENSRKLAAGAGSRKHLSLALRQLGRIAQREERIADAERYLNDAVAQIRDLQAPLAAWRAYASLGELYVATRRADQARTSFGAALQILRDLADHAPEMHRKAILGSEQVRDLQQKTGL